jgi:1-acyl-sn-glycerol-3-phosphate acyltransferase
MFRKLLQTLYGVYAAATFVVLVLLLCCPLLIMAPTLPMRRAIGRFAVRAWCAASFIPFRIRGLSHIPAGPCIAICNHASYLDGILLTAALPSRFTFLVQHGAGDWPYVGLVIRRMGASLVNRTSARAAAQATREMLDRVAAGESFAIFPEGTFRRAPALLPFQAGAFVIASRAGVPVLPAVIQGSRTVFGEGQKMLRWQPIRIEFLAPIPSPSYSREAANALRDTARAVVLAHCGEADGLSNADLAAALANTDN